MEAGNRRIYAKDMTSIALTSQHKRGVVGAFVEGKLKMQPAPKKENFQNPTNPNSTRGKPNGRGKNQRGRGSNRGRGGRGGGPNKSGGEDQAKPNAKRPRGGGEQHTRGEPQPIKSKKKLVDRIQDPHVQAIIRDQLEKGDFLWVSKRGRS